MEKIELIEYEPWHIDEIIDKLPRERELRFSVLPEWSNFKKGWKTEGPGYTLIINNEIIVSAGVVMMGWNRGEAWMVASNKTCQYGKSLFSTVKNKLERIIQVYSLRRVQATVEVDFEAAKRFMRHLKFTEEYLLSAFGPMGQDMILFGRKC